MLACLLKSTLCMGVLLLAYLFFLEKEKMHSFNRFYLLGSIIFSLIIPLITISKPIPVLTEIPVTFLITQGDTHAVHSSISSVAINNSPANPIPFLPILYCLIASILSVRFATNLYKISTRASKNPSVILDGARLVLLKENVVSHTFLKNIFINEEEYQKGAIENELFTHEMAHVSQKHSYDIIFLEILQALCWFNPLLILYKRAIQLNHEFLADDAVIKAYKDVPAYQHLLLDKISLNSNHYLASAFNYSVTKKRFVMMTATQNTAAIVLKKLLIFPIIAIAIVVFSSSQAISQDKKETVKNTPMTKQVPKLRMYPWDLPITNQDGVSNELLAEYNSIISAKIKFSDNRKNAVSNLSNTERNRLLAIYRQMSQSQRHDASIGFYKRSEPVKKSFPTDAQLEKWKKTADYGVWIDGKKVSNDKLNNYKASDFSHYDASNLAYTDKMKKDIMEQYGLKVMYKVQLDLMTTEGYEKYYKASIARPEFTMFHHITHIGNREVEGRMGIDENN